MTMTPRNWVQWIVLAVFIAGITIARWTGPDAARRVGEVFVDAVGDMLMILPCAFVLLGLFDQWVKRETVQRHLGGGSGVRGYLWAMLLGGMAVGGVVVALPIAYTLARKGASLKVVFAFLGFAGVCRIPMTLFEMMCLGVTFTVVRLAVAIPAMLIVGIAMGTVLQRRGYALRE